MNTPETTIKEREREQIIDSDYILDKDIGDEERKSIIEGFYRTKEKTIAAYLKARGYNFRGMEKILITNISEKKKVVFAFCFDGGNVTRRAILEYYNTDDSKVLNVNAKLILNEFRNINSLIANF